MSLIQVLLCLGALIVVEYSTPAAARMRLSANITFRNVFVSAMLVTPDDRLLVGGMMGDGLSGLVSIDLQQPTSARFVPNAPGTVHSLTLLSDGDLMVTQNTGDEIAKVLDLGGEEEEARVVKVILDSGVKNATWYMVASLPSSPSSTGADNINTNNSNDVEKIIVTGYNRNADRTFIDVMSRDGDVIEHLADDLDVSLQYLVVHDGDLYLALYEDRPALMRFSLATKTFVPNIGRLELASAFGSDYKLFTQGSFDQRGNLYIGADRGCDSMRLRPRTSCGHVLRISPDGETKVVVPRQKGRVDHEHLHLQAVTVTPRGIAVAYVAYNLRRTEGVVRLYEFDLDD